MINMKNKLLLTAIAISVISMKVSAQDNGTFTDTRDGKTYKTMVAGTQTWFAENLAFKADSGCWAYDNKKANIATYGYLYNWQSAKMSCPTGWRLPVDNDWKILSNFLGGDSIAGYALKESGTSHWDSTNVRVTNSSGFTALPGGCSSAGKAFFGIRKFGFWWSSTYLDAHYGGRFMLTGTSGETNIDGSDDSMGFSVRCLKD